LPRFSDRVVTARLLLSPTERTRDGALRALLHALAEAGHLAPDGVEPTHAVLLRREELGSTGLGQGLALPHARTPHVTERVVALGVVRGEPIADFETLDREPVDLLLLALAPPPSPSDRLQADDTLIRALRDAHFVDQLRAAGSAAQLMDLVRQYDAPHSP
jgi:PTS system fructose-specific IIA component/PTS system nitrogen regulatory IIA component